MTTAPVIYAPKGAAAEYAELACNLRMSCTHGCTYCYCPAVCHLSRETFFAGGPPKANALTRLERDCYRMTSPEGGEPDTRRLLLSFVGDLFDGQDPDFSRHALCIISHHGVRFDVLTKGGLRAADSFPYIKVGGRFGTSLIWARDDRRECWEPNTAPIEDRLEAIGEASRLGIYCWASVEPVLHPWETTGAIRMLGSAGCQEVRLGRRRGDNHIDWSLFCDCALSAINETGMTYQVKASLREFWPAGVPTDTRPVTPAESESSQ